MGGQCSGGAGAVWGAWCSSPYAMTGDSLSVGVDRGSYFLVEPYSCWFPQGCLS